MNVFHYKIFIFIFAFFSYSSFGMEEEMVFELRREAKKSNPIKKRKTIPLKFKRKSFSYNKDFLVFNEKSNSSLKKGSILRANIPYPVIASFDEEFPIYGIVVHPFNGIVSGKIKGVKNTNKALIVFDEIIVNSSPQKIESFPVFLNGDLKESLFKNIALNFFESLPSILALSLKTKVPPSQIHFVNTDLKNKMENLSVIETEKRKLLQYLEFKDIKLFNIIIK